MDEINRVHKVNNLYSSNTIHLPTVSHTGNCDSTREQGERLRGRPKDSTVNVDGNVEKEQCTLTKENETLGHGIFEDEQLVNVVQNLVISRYRYR